MNKNNTWHYIGNPEITYIFIHGLLSDSEKCWKNDNGTYWPDLLKTSDDFNSGSIYLSGFHTSINSGTYDLRQCAIEVLESFKISKNNNPRPIDSKNIVFICHSLGGIICRHLLELEPNLFKDKKLGLVLLASPSEGSDYAEFFNGLARLLENKVVKNLKKSSPILKDIDDRFRDLINRRELDLVGTEACEQKGPKISRYIPIRLKRIVDERSASRYFGGTRTLPNTDHMSISKPTDEEHCSHKFLLAFIQKNFQQAPSKAAYIENNINGEYVDHNVLFDSFNEKHKDVYSVRSIDSKLEHTLHQRSLWIYGPSGCGKTTAARHAIINKQGTQAQVEITLSHLDITKLSSKEFYQEIIESIETLDEKFPHKASTTSKIILATTESSTIPILFDEVGISREKDQTEFLNLISELLNEIKQKSKSQKNFVICSINEPNFEHAPDKFREYFEKVQLKKWSDQEQMNLINLILEELKIKSSDDQLTTRLVKSANGSPRYIKTFFRNIQTKKIRDISESNTKQLIELTSAQLKGMV
jgi:ABC-type dipeptide/oligopeptide/nickel transport system ATPase subunit